MSAALDSWSRNPGAKPMGFNLKLQLPCYALNDPGRRKQLLGQVRCSPLLMLL